MSSDWTRFPYSFLASQNPELLHRGRDNRQNIHHFPSAYPSLDEEVLDFVMQGNYKGIGFDVIGLDPIPL